MHTLPPHRPLLVGQGDFAYAALASTYDQAVGPWKAYLGILLRRDAAEPVA